MLVDSDVIFAESRMSFTIKPWSSKIDVTSVCTFLPLWFKILFWWFHTFEPCCFWLYSPICETFNKFKCSREENIVGRRTTPTKNFYNHKKDSLKFQFFVIKNLLETDINIIDFFSNIQTDIHWSMCCVNSFCTVVHMALKIMIN